MSGFRHEPRPAGSVPWKEGDSGPARGTDVLLQAQDGPHGYDPVEFGPGESRRDFPQRRERKPDEERRLLKEFQAAFEGPDKRHDVDDGPDVDAVGPDCGAEEEMGRPSRLYRD